MYKIEVCNACQCNDGSRVQERYHLLKRLNRQLTKLGLLRKQKTAGTKWVPRFLQNRNNDVKYNDNKEKA